MTSSKRTYGEAMKSVAPLLAVCGLILTGCAVTPNQNEIGPYPASYEKIVKTHILRTFFDPYSIRSASISEPVQGHLLFQQGYIVCVELNAKNRMGGYIGLQKTAYLLNRDTVVQTMTKAPLCNSPQLNFSPWPELEQMQ